VHFGKGVHSDEKGPVTYDKWQVLL